MADLRPEDLLAFVVPAFDAVCCRIFDGLTLDFHRRRQKAVRDGPVIRNNRNELKPLVVLNLRVHCAKEFLDTTLNFLLHARISEALSQVLGNDDLCVWLRKP